MQSDATNGDEKHENTRVRSMHVRVVPQVPSSWSQWKKFIIHENSQQLSENGVSAWTRSLMPECGRLLLSAARKGGGHYHERNDLESVPFELLICGAGNLIMTPNVHYRAMIVFTTARCLHAYATTAAMQPRYARSATR
ncbi:unnamed protein product [Phytophthora fragariaefolia]|uniref:Unnamed protein product n=1 Tax=Phytophthora fragariaefolia TaxID=1490495 RepID=A0A9W6XZK7_9STRA|nr:unnamed protein product [Phytophthora fragariaefolia]